MSIEMTPATLAPSPRTAPTVSSAFQMLTHGELVSLRRDMSTAADALSRKVKAWMAARAQAAGNMPLAADGGWREDDHPRDTNGKFKTGAGGAALGTQTAAAQHSHETGPSALSTGGLATTGAAAQPAGVIGSPAARTDQPAAARSPWPWTSQPRQTEMRVVARTSAMYAAQRMGVFTDTAGARRLACELMAGVPEGLKVEAVWFVKGDRLRVQVDHADVYIERSFQREGRELCVEHDYFSLAEKYQGGGHAVRMLQASLEAYDRLGVSRVDVHANIDKGGYVWARNGFVPNAPDVVREALRRMAARMEGARKEALLKVVDFAPDLTLMYNVATLQDDGGKWGAFMLMGSDWYGHAHLADPAHRALIARALDR